MDVERARTVKGWLPRRLGEIFFIFFLLPPFDNFFDSFVGFFSVVSISVSAKYPWTLIMGLRASYLGETKKNVKWIDAILLSQTSTFFHGSIQDSLKAGIRSGCCNPSYWEAGV